MASKLGIVVLVLVLATLVNSNPIFNFIANIKKGHKRNRDDGPGLKVRPLPEGMDTEDARSPNRLSGVRAHSLDLMKSPFDMSEEERSLEASVQRALDAVENVSTHVEDCISDCGTSNFKRLSHNDFIRERNNSSFSSDHASLYREGASLRDIKIDLAQLNSSNPIYVPCVRSSAESACPSVSHTSERRRSSRFRFSSQNYKGKHQPFLLPSPETMRRCASLVLRDSSDDEPRLQRMLSTSSSSAGTCRMFEGGYSPSKTTRSYGPSSFQLAWIARLEGEFRYHTVLMFFGKETLEKHEQPLVRPQQALHMTEGDSEDSASSTAGSTVMHQDFRYKTRSKSGLQPYTLRSMDAPRGLLKLTYSSGRLPHCRGPGSRILLYSVYVGDEGESPPYFLEEWNAEGLVSDSQSFTTVGIYDESLKDNQLFFVNTGSSAEDCFDIDDNDGKRYRIGDYL